MKFLKISLGLIFSIFLLELWRQQQFRLFWSGYKLAYRVAPSVIDTGDSGYV